MSGLCEVVVRVHAGLLRLRDVVVRSGEGEGGGSSDAESHTRCESVAGFAISSDGSLSVRGGSVPSADPPFLNIGLLYKLPGIMMLFLLILLDSHRNHSSVLQQLQLFLTHSATA